MKKKLYLNTTVSLVFQICSVVIGLILPRMILQRFGSEVNGLTNSIVQMLSVIALLDLGVGAVVQSSLYKPLFDKDNERISAIYSSAKNFFNVIAGILVIYVVLLCFYYGLFKAETFSWVYSTTLILAIAISYFAQYFFGMSNTLLLNADQKGYIVTLINLITFLLNAVATIVLLKLNYSIQFVKLVSSLIYVLRPIFFNIYVKRHYKLQKVHTLSEDVLPEKWNGLAQHIAAIVTNSVDVVVLTLFSTLNMVSVYTIYVMPLNSIKNLFEITSTGYKSFLGSLVAKDDKEELVLEFNRYEVIMHFIIIVVFTTMLKTLLPFVLVYTDVVSSAEYNNLLFSVAITLAYTMYSLRLPYTNLIFAAGKFKETQKYSIVEVGLNIIISILFVNYLGLIGVAIGTVVSSAYRLITSAYFLSKNVLSRPINIFFNQLLIDILCVIIILGITSLISMETNSFMLWLIYATLVFFIALAISIIIFSIFKRKYFNPQKTLKKISNTLRRKV